MILIIMEICDSTTEDNINYNDNLNLRALPPCLEINSQSLGLLGCSIISS